VKTATSKSARITEPSYAITVEEEKTSKGKEGYPRGETLRKSRIHQYSRASKKKIQHLRKKKENKENYGTQRRISVVQSRVPTRNPWEETRKNVKKVRGSHSTVGNGEQLGQLTSVTK